MIQVERIDSAGAEWDAVVAQCEGNALHLPAIQLPYHKPGDLQLLKLERDQQPVACAIGFEVKSRRWGLGGKRALHLPTAPAIADPSLAAEIRASLFAFARESGFERMVIYPANSRGFSSDEDLAPYRTESITEFVLDLRPGADAVLAGLSKIHRKNIRRAAKQELRVEEDSSLQGLLHLRDLQLASSERASAKTEGFDVQQEDLFQKLHEHVYAPGFGHVLFAYLNDEPVTALAWIAAAGRVQTVRSGSLPVGYRSRAMYLLHDALIRRVVDEGMIELNIGGVPSEASEKDHPQSGLYEFKNGFGGQPMVRHALDIPLKEIQG